MNNSVDESCDEQVIELKKEIFHLNIIIEEKDREIASLCERINELTVRTKMNSSNSSRPPSTDGFKRPNPKSLREKSGKRPGGQPGHKGKNIVLPHEPDEIIEHLPDKCSCCTHLSECRKNHVFENKESRFVIDAVMKVKVTEHRSVQANCPVPKSEKESLPDTGTFPEGISAYIQYGDTMSVLVNLLDSYGYMSDSRISTMLRDIFGISLSAGTVVSMTAKCADKVNSAVCSIRERLKDSDVNHFDETGIRVNGKTVWVHNSSTSQLTYQTVNQKRGKEGIDGNGILPEFKGTAVHDCWGPYFRYGDVAHAVCCAHILRELNCIEDLAPDHRWQRRLKELLLLMKSSADTARYKGIDRFDEKIIQHFCHRYDMIMQAAEKECPSPPAPAKIRRGRKRKGKERSLIERLIQRKDSVCRFVHDLNIPFDNNQAERDVRFVKIKSKVSGQFRNMENAQDFLNITSYLSTARKNGVNAFEALTQAFTGKTEVIFGHKC